MHRRVAYLGLIMGEIRLHRVRSRHSQRTRLASCLAALARFNTIRMLSVPIGRIESSQIRGYLRQLVPDARTIQGRCVPKQNSYPAARARLHPAASHVGDQSIWADHVARQIRNIVLAISPSHQYEQGSWSPRYLLVSGHKLVVILTRWE